MRIIGWLVMRTYDNTKFPFVNKERNPEKNIKDTTVQY